MKKTAILALALVSIPLLAQDPPKKIDVSKLPKQTRMVEDVIVPVPSEIFTVLDKLGNPNWSATQRPIKGVAKPLSGDRGQQALYLGTVIAEGFIAVEAKDAAEVKNIGRSVLSLSKNLGVEDAVVKRANAIVEEADKGNWVGVRRELDGALTEVKRALDIMKSSDLANLVALGGWVRGTEALCQVVMRDYNPEGADLLHQPGLVNHFLGKVAGLGNPRLKKEPLVTKSHDALIKIKPLIGTEEGTEIKKETVASIGQISADLVKSIQTKPTE
jgi:hypothetical protein